MKTIKCEICSEPAKIMNRRNEIMNALEKMVDALYEVGHEDSQYFEEVIGETMDIVMERD